MIKYLEPDMEIIYLECDAVVCSNPTLNGNEGAGNDDGEDYDNW